MRNLGAGRRSIFLSGTKIPAGAGGGGSPDIILTYVGTTLDETNTTTYTFAGVDLGPIASGQRSVIAVFQIRPNAGTVTISGQADLGGSFMNTLVEASINFGTTTICGLINNDATADISITYSGTCLGCSLTIYSLENGTDTAYDSGTDTAGSAGVYSQSIDCEAGGVIIGGNAIIGTGDFTWTNLTEDMDSNLATTNLQMTTASSEFASAQVGLTITSTLSSGGSSGSHALVAISKAA